MSTSAVDLVFVTAGVRFAYLFGSRATGCHRRRAGGAAPWSRRLRNRLVGVYDEIDDARVHQALATGLPDFDAFATSLARLET